MFDRRWKLSSLQNLATDLRNFQAAMAQRVRGAKNILMCDFNSNGIMKIHSCDSWSAPLSIFFYVQYMEVINMYFIPLLVTCQNMKDIWNLFTRK